MSEASKLSQQVVALVLAHVGVRSNPEARHDAAVNVDAHLRELRQRLAQVEKERDDALMWLKIYKNDPTPPNTEYEI